MYKLLLGFLLGIISQSINAQSVEVNGYFLDDSLKIGIGTPYILTSKYPSEKDLIFPDSLYNFTPFELGEKWFAHTNTKNGISYDSAVYYLISFEVDSIQYFKLPVLELIGRDTIQAYAKKDSIYLTHLVEEIPDSIALESMPLIENANYRYVDFAWNYPYLIIACIAFLLLIIIVYVVFGKRIMKYFKIRKLDKAHLKFLSALDKYNKVEQKQEAEKVLFIWKNYLEQLDHLPYTKYTTKEILAIRPFEEIEENLRSFDRFIYSNSTEPQALDTTILQSFAISKYEDKKKEVHNG